MDRRTLLVGTASAVVGSGAIIGTGAYSRVESDRDATIQVAQDPDAYLGLDRCDTPNGEYALIDDNGHLAIEMSPDNEDVLGDGLNSNSRTFADNVFQITNQGKEEVCVWIQDSDDWPTFDGERRVQFYVGSSEGASDLDDLEDQSLISDDGSEGEALDVGESICVGVAAVTKDLSEGDRLLADLDDTIQLNADVDGACQEIIAPGFPYYQIDLVEGEPLEIIHGDEDETYSSENRLLSALHGDWEGGIISEEHMMIVDDHVDALVDEDTIEYDIDIETATATVSFELADDCWCDIDELDLAFTSYGSVTEGWDPSEVQELFAATEESFTEGGEYTMTVALPPLSEL